ncbi:unnamed protein product, partial [Amoebophrya sp. A25]
HELNPDDTVPPPGTDILKAVGAWDRAGAPPSTMLQTRLDIPCRPWKGAFDGAVQKAPGDAGCSTGDLILHALNTPDLGEMESAMEASMVMKYFSPQSETFRQVLLKHGVFQVRADCRGMLGKPPRDPTTL